MADLDKRLEAMEWRGVELERSLRDCGDGSAVPAVLPSARPSRVSPCCFCFRRGGGGNADGVVYPQPRAARAGAQRHGAGLPVSLRHMTCCCCCSCPPPRLKAFCGSRTMQQRLEERQADVEYELRRLFIKQGRFLLGFSFFFLN